MIQRLRDLLRLPSPLATDPAYTSRTVERFAAVEMPALLLPLAHNWAGGHFSTVAVMAAQEIALLVAFWLNRLGRITVAGRLLCVSNWFLITGICVASRDGVHDLAIYGFPVLLLVAGLLLELGLYLGFSLLVIGSVAGLGVAEIGGWLVGPAGRFSTVADVVDLTVIHGLAAAAVAVVVQIIRRALAQTREHEEALAASRAALEKQAATLRTSDEKLRLAMELAVEGITHADPEGRIVQANTRAAEITGYPSAELLGRLFTDFFSTAELTRVPIRWDLLDRGEIVTTERQLTRKDGSVIIAEMTSQRLPDRTLQCFVRDITARRMREEQLQQTQRLEALGTLAGGVAHDFNNLLTVMHGALDAVDAAPALPESLKLPLLDLRSAASRAGDLTQQMLAFARRQPLERKRMDLRTAVEQNARMLRRLLGPQIELVVDCPPPPCPVLADGGMLTHVVMNLAVNARDAMPAGGRLVLAVRTEDLATPPRFNGRDFPAGRYVCLRVTDQGSGMDEATRRRIFEPFFTTKEQGKGTGLGLSVSLSVVQQHDGWIEVDSVIGRGTTFRVYLPALPEMVEVPPAAEPAPVVVPLALGTGKLLLVEDEEPVRRLAMGALQMSGFNVLEAANGKEALELWKLHGAEIELLLTDVAMPGGLSGVDVVKACRADRPRLPVIVTSGYSQDSVAFGDGFWDDVRFLPKPFTMASLAAAVRDALSRAS